MLGIGALTAQTQEEIDRLERQLQQARERMQQQQEAAAQQQLPPVQQQQQQLPPPPPVQQQVVPVQPQPLQQVTGIPAANVSNVRVSQQGGMLIVTYDLAVRSDVEVLVSFDNGATFRGPLRHVSGAVGRNQQPQRDKVLIWSIVPEIGYVDFPHMIVKVVANAVAVQPPLPQLQLPPPIITTADMLFADRRKVSQGGRQLSQSEVRQVMAGANSFSALQLYDRSVRRNRTANILLCIYGGGVIATGLIGGAIYSYWGFFSEFLLFAGGAMILGSPLLITAIIMKPLSSRDVRNSTDMFNRSLNRADNTKIELNFGITQNGVGLVLNF